jgi:DNA-binding transcriptional regulator YhcF (GntR family)
MSSNLIYLQTVRKKKAHQMELNAVQNSLFQSVEEMNDSLDSFLDEHGSDLSDTALILLAVLSQHSCVAAGVSWLSVRSMAALVGVTDRTIQVALRSLESVGVIKRIATRTHNGGQGNNYIAIQPYGIPVEEEMAAHEITEGYVQAAAGSHTFTGGNRERITGGFTQSYLNYSNSLKVLDDDLYKQQSFKNYRYQFYFETATEKNIPMEIAQALLPYINEQIMTTSWIALGAAFCKLKEHARNIGKLGPWFSETLRNENMLVKIGATG